MRGHQGFSVAEPVRRAAQVVEDRLAEERHIAGPVHVAEIRHHSNFAPCILQMRLAFPVRGKQTP
jgi:hypothetical protein